jgi:uncharacterized membrane protein
MSVAHLHLLLNHFPVVGTIIVTVILGWALVGQHDEVTKVALALIAGIAAVSVVVFFTGEPAEETIENLPGFSEAITERHEEFALIATIVLGALGALALGALVFLKGRAAPRWITVWTFVLSIIASGVMGYTALLGGQIRHTEVRPAVTLNGGE